MVKLHEIFRVHELEDEIANGYVTRRFNEAGTLAILNYGPKAQYDNRWNAVTKACRGLIYDVETLEVVARPFEKFFNWGQEQAPKFADDEQVRVLDKADGSLIVAAWYKDRFICASRGSFQSEQAIAAQGILDSTVMTVEVGMTYIFELVGPSNRIVLSYPEDTLIFLGSINTETGEYIFPEKGDTPFQPVQEFKFSNFREALSAPPRPNAEGYIIHGRSGVVKVKQEDYINIHKLIFNLTPKNIWRAMVAGKTLEQIKEPFPDEFYAEIEGIYKSISHDYMAISNEAMSAYLSIDPTLDQKSFAFEVKKHPRHLQGLLFSTRAGKPIHETILRMVEPKGDKPRMEEDG